MHTRRSFLTSAAAAMAFVAVNSSGPLSSGRSDDKARPKSRPVFFRTLFGPSKDWTGEPSPIDSAAQEI